MGYKTAVLSLLGLGLIAAPAFSAEPARPGTINYVEGAAYVNGQQIDPRQIGNIDLNQGQELTTGKGKAEILLTPGVFLRVDDNSAVKMISPDLTLTQVEIDKGRAGIEVDEIHDQNNLQVIDAGVTTRLKKTGYYEFDANHPEVMVYKGKADVGIDGNKGKEVKGNHELALDGDNGKSLAQEKPTSFHADANSDELANWSRLRSQYLAEANNELAPQYGESGYYPGWYWNPYGLGYTFIGAGPLYSPWGWGFYPFGWGGLYGGWGGGWYGRPIYGHPIYGHHFEGHERMGVQHGGFAHSSGSMGFHGGNSFHGGAHGR
ncbi:FecR domain-containing protein [Acidobacteria bacterium AB60]|nr:FecR domain-containing protein [Acidobacteria bacterium AB60]